MRTRFFLALAATFTLAPSALPYGQLKSALGALLHRTDYANVQFLLNQRAVPGLTNAAGQIFISQGSDVMAAVASATASWNGVQTSSARFASVQSTSLVNVSGDGHNVIVFLDTPAIRSVLGPSMTAVTIPTYLNDGTILDSDIIFNPAFSFSTTGAPNTFDIQSILTHEMGHSLGANHTGILGAAMFQAEAPNSTAYQNLSQDDIAFVSTVYPAQQSMPSFGSISGTVSLNGAPLRSALVNAIDTGSGTAISALTSALDGTYSMVTPPGNYVIFAQPLIGNIQPGNLYLYTTDAVDTNFSVGFLGGNASPATVAVTAGNVSNGDFSPAPPGNSAVTFQYFNTGGAGGFADQSQLFGIALPQPVVSGQTVDFIILGPGIDSTLIDANVMLLGPMTLTPGSVRPDAFIDGNSLLPFIRMTVTIAPVSSPTPATLIITKNGSVSSYTGGLILMPPPAPAQPPM